MCGGCAQHSTPIPPLEAVEGTKLTEKCGSGSVRDRFLAFPGGRRRHAPRAIAARRETLYVRRTWLSNPSKVGLLGGDF